MKISVVIPVYNSSKFIEATLESVLFQTVVPDEILVLDDGSTDNTVALLKRYEPRITLFFQQNRGVSHTRNALCNKAIGDLIAFLDHDDIWHPNYLAEQKRLFEDYPQAVAFFVGHENFFGYNNYLWNIKSIGNNTCVEEIDPVNFINRYRKGGGLFGSMSFCCIPKIILNKIGSAPFCVNGVDDLYLLHRLILFGSIVYYPRTLVAYRITSSAQSSNLLKACTLATEAFELLEPDYKKYADLNLYKSFKVAFASQRRGYAKVLMGVGRALEARIQLRLSIEKNYNILSLIKSSVMLCLTHMPESLQPKWPPEWKATHSKGNIQIKKG